jgi:hypothetical protein
MYKERIRDRNPAFSVSWFQDVKNLPRILAHDKKKARLKLKAQHLKIYESWINCTLPQSRLGALPKR